MEMNKLITKNILLIKKDVPAKTEGSSIFAGTFDVSVRDKLQLILQSNHSAY